MTGLPYKLGDHGEEIGAFQDWFARKFKSYAPPRDEYYGSDEVRAVSEMQRRIGVPITGRFDAATASHPKVMYPGFEPRVHRPIWFYSLPGSGNGYDVGPSYDVGERCKTVLNLNHQPIGSPIGGYLGLMGGDPGLSYIEVITAQGIELERQIANCPDIANPAWEGWISGYSQSADAVKEAVKRLFGPHGRFEHLWPRINGLILFGDPTAVGGTTKVGNQVPGKGIANKVFPDWLESKVWDITNTSPTPDFYACQTTQIASLFYEWFIRAETSLPFAVYCGQIIIPALLNLVSPLLGGVASPLAAGVLMGGTGAGLDLIGPLLGGVLGATEKPNPDLVKLLSVQGLLTNLPALFGLLAAMPGIMVHGNYWEPKPEFGGRSGVDVGYDIVAGFRR